MSLSKGPYNPLETEPEILKFWLNNKFFKPEYHPKKGLQTTEEMKKDPREPYCIINPPPNANGRPHIGNASGYSYQDMIGRFHRMLGKKTLLFPGKDHAGIESEIVFERKKLKPKGITKVDLGREEFYKECYKFCVEQSKKARDDEARMGMSSDYDRDVFTLDPAIVDIVLDTFIKLYNDGLIYKGVRIINWCPDCQTALADIDCERIEREATLTYIKYPLNLDMSFEKALIEKFNGKEVEMKIEKIKGDHLTIQPSDHLKSSKQVKSDYKYEFDYGFIKKIKSPGDNEDLDAILLSSKKHKKGETASAKAIGLIYNSWHDPKLILSNEDLENKEELIQNYLNSYNPEGVDKDYVFFEKMPKDFEIKLYIAVATTRPETMLGDTAVTVNPKDERYKHLIGETAMLPLVDREIPIIADPMVEMEFGTGAVKVTPAHAPEDYEVMLKHNKAHPDAKIDYINVIWKDQTMVGPIGKYKGMKVEEARKEVVSDLQKLELIIKTEKIKQNVSICERSKTVIEPLISSQWYLEVEKLKKPALEAVKSRKIKIHPKYMTKKYTQWLEELRNWPISRSLWWGYRIPVWYKGELNEKVDENGKIIEKVGKDKLDTSNKLQVKVQQESPGEEWVQDQDILDTWFSSGQWAYAPLMKEDLLDTFYPTDTMETMHDILEKWVSRMVMLGIYRVGDIPFRDVYLHGMVLGPDGQKMSKSRGNVVMPDDVIQKEGADTLRLFYYIGNKAGAQYRVDYEKIKGNRNFLNKIWNASKFVLMNIEDTKEEIVNWEQKDLELNEDDKKMLKEINTRISETTKKLEEFKLGLVSQELYESFWHTFCDWYLEAVKQRLYKTDRDGNPINTSEKEQKSRKAAQWTLWKCLKTYLELMHPMIPFITEKIWQELPKEEGSVETIMYQKWPGKI